jgi:hypothetical protein
MKQKLLHAVGRFLKIFIFLAPLLCAFSAYRMLLLHQVGEEPYRYGAALISALVLSKLVLIGEDLGLGERYERKPLLYSVIYKSFVFTLLAALFHVLEDAITGLLHGEGFAGAFAALGSRGVAEVLVAAWVLFCAFMPFFALRELERVLSERRFRDLFLRPGATAE